MNKNTGMRYLWLLIGTAIAVGAIRFLFTDVPDASYFVQHLSYYENWVLLVWLAYWIWANGKRTLVGSDGASRLLRAHWMGLVLAFVIPLMWQVSNERMLKTMQDELSLSATAKTYAVEREAKLPNSTVQVGGELVVSTYVQGKRPTMFPFIVSLVHNFTGYRVENVYVVNFGLSVILFILLYGLGVSGFGRQSAIGLQLLAGAIPLFAQQATSGSYELLNLCALVGLWLSGQHFLKRKDPESLSLFVTVALFFARCRYESILGLLVVAVVWGIVVYRERKLILNYFVCLSPLLLLAPLFSNAVLMSQTALLEKPAEAATFSFTYFPENLINAIYYLFSGGFSSAPVISLMGMAGLVVVGINLRSAVKSPGAINTVNYVMVAFIIGLTIFYLTCFWGNWADGVATRFSMPFLLLCCVATAMAFSILGKKAGVVLIMIAAAHLLVFYRPYSNTNYDDGGSYPRLESHWWMNFMKQHLRNDVLYIGPEVLGAYLLEKPGISLKIASLYPEAVDYALRVNYYRDVYMLMRYHVSDDDAASNALRKQLEAIYELDPVDTLSIRTDTYSVIYRVKGVKPEQLAKRRIAIPEGSETVPGGVMKFNYAGLPGFYPSKLGSDAAGNQ